jgi:hypothetical protein
MDSGNTKRIVAPTTISKLNARARYHNRRGERPFIAIQSAASDLHLIEVKRDDSTILYRNRHRAYVNCWIEGPMGQAIEPGGAGFDAQIDWAFD